MDKSFILNSVKRSMLNSDTVLFDGAFPMDNPDKRSLHAFLNGEEIPIKFSEDSNFDVIAKYSDRRVKIAREITGEVKLTEPIHKFTIEERINKSKRIIYKVTENDVDELLPIINGNIDYYEIKDDEVVIYGWAAVSKDAVFSAEDKDEKSIPVTIKRKYRKDVRDLFKEVEGKPSFGFEIYLPEGNYGKVTLFISDKGEQRSFMIDLKKPLQETGYLNKDSLVIKGIKSLKDKGFKATIYKVIDKLENKKKKEEQSEYQNFLKLHPLTKAELEKQRTTKFSNEPVISIVIPIYNTPLKFLKELIESVLNQTYSRWQLCLADGSDTDRLKKYVEKYSENDSRVLYHLLGFNDGISNNTNGAIKMAEGEFIAFMDHDDLLTPDALYEVVKGINSDSRVDCVYSDEDKIDMDGKTLFMPHFKPDLDIDLLCSYNYITHLFVARKSIVDEIGGLRKQFDGSQDHDMIFRCIEKSRKVYHVRKVLYHWRCHKNSTAMNPESKLYCYEAGRDAVQAHWDRLGVPAKVEMAQNYGHYITHYHWGGEPLVSIVIPNMNHKEDLERCIESIREKSSYTNYEIIIVENNSTEQNIFDFYKQLEKDPKIHIIKYDGTFNYSLINNFGVEHSKGEYLLFLNNDTALDNTESIKEMLDICRRSDVGAVGARLYYADNTVQHAGVVLGVGGVANHAFYRTERGDVGYFFRSISVQDYSAVTAACMMTGREEFKKVGGFSKDLAIAFNDVDYCLKLRKENFLVVYTPFSEWYHYESKSRGYDDTPEKAVRLQTETDIFMSKWKDVIKGGDPYYSPNFNQQSADFQYNMDERIK